MHSSTHLEEVKIPLHKTYISEFPLDPITKMHISEYNSKLCVSYKNKRYISKGRETNQSTKKNE